MPQKWNSPHEWLIEKATHEWTPDEVLDTLCDLVRSMDSDTLQDVFQTEMEKDGYFDEEHELHGLLCHTCGEELPMPCPELDCTAGEDHPSPTQQCQNCIREVSDE